MPSEVTGETKYIIITIKDLKSRNSKPCSDSNGGHVPIIILNKTALFGPDCNF